MSSKTIRVPEDLHMKLKIEAVKQKKNLQDLCVKILTDWLENRVVEN
jgi:predicted HicB family RNase H-like nuclease